MILSPISKENSDLLAFRHFFLLSFLLALHEQGFKSVLDHMFCSMREKLLAKQSPFVTIFEYKLENGPVFGSFPGAANIIWSYTVF